MTNIELLKTIRDALIAAVEVMENRLDDCDASEPDEAPDTACPVYPLKDLGLSTRAYHCLVRAGFTTLNEVVNRLETPEHLMAVRNLGVRSHAEVIECAHRCGLRWAWEVEA